MMGFVCYVREIGSGTVMFMGMKPRFLRVWNALRLENEHALNGVATSRERVGGVDCRGWSIRGEESRNREPWDESGIDLNISSLGGIVTLLCMYTAFL